MAFSFGGTGNSGFGSTLGGLSNAQTQTALELEEVLTEALGFQSINGESKVRLLPTPWPPEALPPPTASLLSIASTKGLLAAAGPDSVVIASTDSVRAAFEAVSSNASDIKPFSPQLTLPIGTRVSQVAFSSDENYLVISAETGGGLAVYDVPSIIQGNTRSAFELSTDGVSIRALTPNPATEKAELFAVILTNGQLLIADMKSRQYLSGPTGQILKDGVSCVSWSKLGKQLIAGLGNGGGFQMTPNGESKGDIPKPPGIEGDQHVSSILWLESKPNNIFLMAHTPSVADQGMVSPTTFTLVTRQNPTSYTFQKLPDVCGPYGLNRSPSFQFIQRLKDFPPALEDILIVASTSSEDIGVFAKSKTPLTSEMPADRITNVFTTVSMANDSRRAQVPMTEDMTSNTSAIGMAMDMSSKSKVVRPLPGEEMDESMSPVPALMILNNDGVLVAWWVIYADSIRQGTTYPGLVAAAGGQQQQNQMPASTTPIAAAHPSATPAFGQATFGQNTFGTSSPLGALGAANQKPLTPAFGTGGTSSTGMGAFGASSGLGMKQSPWGTPGTAGANSAASAFGKPAFGAATPMGTSTQGASFGATGGLGNRSSPWGAPVTATPTAAPSPFSTPGGLGLQNPAASGNASSTGIFGASKTTNSSGTGGGFASFANGPGFAAGAAAKGSGESVFAKTTTATSFSSNMDIGSSFGGTPSKPVEKLGGIFGTGEGFVLGTGWKNENFAQADLSKPSDEPSMSLFGTEFGKTLGDTTAHSAPLQLKEADMISEKSDDNNRVSSESTIPPTTITPTKVATAQPIAEGWLGTQTQSQATSAAVQTSTPAGEPATSNFFTVPPKAGGLFSTQAQSDETLAAVGNSTPAPSIFAKATPPLASPAPKSPIIKTEPTESPPGVSKSLPLAALPPESTSKTSYTPGNSSTSSVAASKNSEDSPSLSDVVKTSDTKSPKAKNSYDDMPLPPDFLLPKAKPVAQKDQVPEESVLPIDNGEDGENDSDYDDDDGNDGGDSDDGHNGFDGEGSGVDVEQEISPISDPNQSPKVTPESSFGAQSEKSPLGGMFTKIGRPKTKPCDPLFGELGSTSVPYFPIPSKAQQSPRSPSPIRAGLSGDLLRPDAVRSISAHAIPPRAGMNRKVTMGRPPQSNVPSRTSAPSKDSYREEHEKVLLRQAQKQAEEEQDLSDREDEKVREELATEVEPTRTLDPFIAHQDYVGNIRKPGIPGQIERVYRDINSMIDTLGLNARSLKAFTKGHREMNKDGGRTREDLEYDADWVLIEIADLATVEKSIGSDLEQGLLRDIPEKLNSCRDMQREISKMSKKSIEMKRTIKARSDPDKIEALRSAPLSAEQSVMQHDLRIDFANFQKLLAEAEEGVSLLRAKLASLDGSKRQGPRQTVPTVEAVERTILKMTGMIEKKSGDIDVLELQMRKLNMTGNVSSKQESPFVTPPTSARKNGLSRTPASKSSLNGKAEFFTPRSSVGGTFRDSVATDTNGMNDTSRKGMNYITDEDVIKYSNNAKRRKEVKTSLKDALNKRGIRVRSMDDN
ncbi:hypothetical protein MMC26_001181 [Xylographa opegraphella]|nr:hypothetical protein [Xylographa opegraphella]